MEDTKKITKEELEIISSLQFKANNAISNIGLLEVKKQQFLAEVNSINKLVDEHKSLLFQKYGDINIDINDGSYSSNPVEENNANLRKV